MTDSISERDISLILHAMHLEFSHLEEEEVNDMIRITGLVTV